MDEILKALAEHTGISQETARTALGAILAFLKEHLPAGLSSQLMNSVPEAQQLTSAYESTDKPAEGGGRLLGAVSGLVTKLLGENAGEAAKLVAMLQNSGLDLKQIETFIPKVFELIKAHIPPDLFEKIAAILPAAKPDAR